MTKPTAVKRSVIKELVLERSLLGHGSKKELF